MLETLYLYPRVGGIPYEAGVQQGPSTVLSTGGSGEFCCGNSWDALYKSMYLELVTLSSRIDELRLLLRLPLPAPALTLNSIM